MIIPSGKTNPEGPFFVGNLMDKGTDLYLLKGSQDIIPDITSIVKSTPDLAVTE